MTRVAFTTAALLAMAMPALAQPAASDPHAGHMMEMQAPAQAAKAPRNPNLPPDAAAAPEQLKNSPRHQEWVDIKDGSNAPIKAFVVYPERKDKAPVVIVIHEIFGLSDWVRGVADQLAKEGFVAIAPDFLSGKGPNGGGSQELGEQQSTKVISSVTRDDTNRMLDAVRAYAQTIPSATGKVATIGFCWGGGTSFGYALHQPALDAAVSYYGPMPQDPAPYANAKAPILGLYGGNDNRVDSGIPFAKEQFAKLHVSYDPHVFDGAGHGFLRQQAGNENAPKNMEATEQAWPLTLEFLRAHTK
ncbi:MAG TPA: dienelactone hydrolase family protein [Vicinamibacterales bacterium]|nr:dienelactone hydrolase family protein [Vicinamibacterales bacterium]